jgi:micrococcal nuclease
MIAPTHHWVFLARIDRIVDGDTVQLTFDTGMHTRRIERCRLLKVNAPEVRGEEHVAGMAAKVWMVQWWAGVRAASDAEFPLIVTTEKDPDHFGRFLCTIWERDNGECLNDALISAGHAVEYVR